MIWIIYVLGIAVLYLIVKVIVGLRNIHEHLSQGYNTFRESILSSNKLIVDIGAPENQENPENSSLINVINTFFPEFYDTNLTTTKKELPIDSQTSNISQNKIFVPVSKLKMDNLNANESCKAVCDEESSQANKPSDIYFSESNEIQNSFLNQCLKTFDSLISPKIGSRNWTKMKTSSKECCIVTIPVLIEKGENSNIVEDNPFVHTSSSNSTDSKTQENLFNSVSSFHIIRSSLQEGNNSHLDPTCSTSCEEDTLPHGAGDCSPTINMDLYWCKKRKPTQIVSEIIQKTSPVIKERVTLSHPCFPLVNTPSDDLISIGELSRTSSLITSIKGMLDDIEDTIDKNEVEPALEMIESKSKKG